MKTVQYQCEICHGEGYPLKSGYKAHGVSFSVLCPDHLMEFEMPKYQFQT
jgi:hypothetical protein